MKKWIKKSKTMHRYDLTAEIYEIRYGKEQATKYKAALECLDINANSIILDVGCGTGLLFRHVAAKAKIIVGVDISIKLLRQAKKNAAELPNVHLIQADADHLPFENNHFNIVFAFTVLQNMPKPSDTLKEIKRNAMHNAIIVVTGLKKVFSLEAFTALLGNGGLKIVALKDTEELKCHVAVTVPS